MTVSVGAGWSIGPGVALGGPGPFAGQATTPGVQNVAGSDGAIGFFFVGNWNQLTGVPNLNDVRPGWLVDQIPGATVVSTDAPTQTITITGGVFVSGSFYTFTGI